MRLILLGTGTGIGKTYFAEVLIRSLIAEGLPVIALKPIETGVIPSGDGAPGAGSDAWRLERAALHVKPPRPHPLYAFSEPVSPERAARLNQKPIDLTAIERWVADAESSHREEDDRVTLIETAGGACSPIAPGVDNLTLADHLTRSGDYTPRLPDRVPARRWLVAANRLGALHDVRAILTASKSSPDLIVLNSATEPDSASASNAEELRRWTRVPVIEIGRDATQVPEALLRHLTLFHTESPLATDS